MRGDRLQYEVVTLYAGFPPEEVIVARVMDGADLIAQAGGDFATTDEAHAWASALIADMRLQPRPGRPVLVDESRHTGLPRGVMAAAPLVGLLAAAGIVLYVLAAGAYHLAKWVATW